MRHWSEVFGNLVSAQDVIDMASTANLKELADYLEKEYYNLYSQALPKDRGNFVEWAEQIKQESLNDSR